MTDSAVPEAHAPFSECHDVSDDRPIRQGDVFEWVSPSTDPLKFLGLVVTADCDIANAKHEGILSYVPILRFVDYLRLFSLPQEILLSSRNRNRRRLSSPYGSSGSGVQLSARRIVRGLGIGRTLGHSLNPVRPLIYRSQAGEEPAMLGKKVTY